MSALSFKTVSIRREDVKKEWLLVDAGNWPLGRLSSRIAMLLRGKHKTSFTPHIDCGDYVIVLNAAKIRISGKKLHDRKHFTYSGYPGGQKLLSPHDLFVKNPTRVLEYAVKRMLPKNRLGRQMFRNLHVYANGTHPHEAQQPKKIDIDKIK
ncbi:MAG: 50S ribosomal protein L13 [Bacteroidetes bacterium]|nr:50S ribosomal protein L13 [Bacteroidota bacterium]